MNKKQIEKDCFDLVKKNIHGTRQSNNIPKYVHSIRVYELLKSEGFSFYVQIAGLLHDILEDSEITKDQLVGLGVPRDSIELIEIVSHDKDVGSAQGKWESKIKKVISEENEKAWAIVVADIIDNMKEPLFTDDIEKMRRYLSSKVAVIMYYASIYLANTNLYTLFLKEYIILVKKINEYGFIEISE